MSPGKVKVTELETIADELESKLEIKLKEIEKLEYEMKSITERRIQLKAKPNLIEDKPSLQNNENKVHMLCIHIYQHRLLFEPEALCCYTCLETMESYMTKGVNM